MRKGAGLTSRSFIDSMSTARSANCSVSSSILPRIAMYGNLTDNFMIEPLVDFRDHKAAACKRET
ncbi:hypothetical protein BSZ25_16230 [Bradyrhizobium canariense]|nr:hypothetical protein BSZ25_16230 [Bradyrhizobium canariense]OSI96238.1 hypothetical protein BSZ24_05040 [Bradyrhizobium canariense]OSJ09218.1 hypothetical protein BSZ16_06860 [Bradyrhizobium canariense]